jgi:hypothetical protein
MKVEQIERNIERSDSFEERSMGLAVGSEAFVFNVLRKDLYSDPIGSLIREYTVNAQDEHRKHGKTGEPILIQVPNRFSPELHIRDFAGGLTEEQVFEFFGNYGASDKRDSNVAVGFFGLGCKSAFAYTDSYVVKSFKDGQAYTFNIYIDETEIGRVAKISSEATDEPNGVEIIVPVKMSDVDEFQRKVIETVSHFTVKPTIEGLAYEPTFGDKKAVIEGDGWAYFGRGETPKVLMGEIAYPVDYYAMGSDIHQWERELLRSDLHIFCEIGEVQVTASREALQMSPKTIAAIRARLAKIKDVMVAETQKAFANAKNLIEAKAIYQSTVASGSGYGYVLKDSSVKIVWNGQEITDSYIRFAPNSSHRVSVYSEDWKGRVKLVAGTTFKPEGEKFYFDDTNGTIVNYKRRATTLLKANGGYRNGNTVTIIHTDDIPDLEKFLGMKVAELESYNAVVPTLPVSNRGAGKGVDLSKRVKHTAKVFVLNVQKTLDFYKGAASECWDVKDVELKGGVYILIQRFHPNTQTMSSIQSLKRTLEKLKAIGIDINVPIYGFKSNEPVKGLITFEEWVSRKLDSNAKLKREVSLLKAYDDCDLLDVRSLNLGALPEGTAKEYAKLYNEMLDAQKKPYSRVLLDVYRNVEVPGDTAIVELDSKVKEKYPLLPLISSYNFQKSQVTDYIKERDSL